MDADDLAKIKGYPLFTGPLAERRNDDLGTEIDALLVIKALVGKLGGSVSITREDMEGLDPKGSLMIATDSDGLRLVANATPPPEPAFYERGKGEGG